MRRSGLRCRGFGTGGRWYSHADSDLGEGLMVELLLVGGVLLVVLVFALVLGRLKR